MSSIAPVAVVDLLISLLEAELGSVFRFMGESSPYLSRATVEVRRPLQEMMMAERRRAGELAALVESITGASASPSVGIRRDEQFLAYLSLKFLLPKLVEEKRLHLQRYDNALRANKPLPNVPGEVRAVLARHAAELRGEVAALEAAAATLAPGRSNGQNDSSQSKPTHSNSDAEPAGG
jgi:hypothetical protein